MKRLKVSAFRDIINKYLGEQITISKAVELINEENGIFDNVPIHKQTGLDLIASERYRQIYEEKFNREHDDQHTDGQLAEAAAVYASFAHGIILEIDNLDIIGSNHISRINALVDELKMLNAKAIVAKTHRWPFDKDWYKPTPDDRIKELTKAGALIVAEIDRLQRIGSEQFMIDNEKSK